MKRLFSLVVFVAIVAALPFATAKDVPDCVGTLDPPCGEFVDSRDTMPTAECCDTLKTVLETDLACVCDIFSSDVMIDALSLNVTEALTLPARCGYVFDVTKECQGIDAVPPPVHQSVQPTPPEKKKVITPIIVAVASGAVLLVLIVVGICIYRMSKPKPFVTNLQHSVDVPQSDPAGPPPPPPPPLVPTAESLQYELKSLQDATNNFSKDHEIGKGGFGPVYKGTLPDGQEIAVKRLAKGSWQGDTEFKNEVVLVAKLQHRNLVRLLGFCLTKEEMLLVYEFVQNKSLDYFLFDPAKRGELNWPKRYSVIKGVARGMLYLHEDSPAKIIHRDLKAANVLLDAELNPKISDFGMARIFPVEQTHANTSKVIGTYGYIAPEYLMQGQFSIKSDVYSFGVLVLEIISGQRVCSLINHTGEDEKLLSYAWRCYRDGRPLDVMDPTLRESYSKDQVTRCIHIGLLCVQQDMNNRPTMGTVVLMLNSYPPAGALLLPQHPGFLFERYSGQSSNTDSAIRWSQSEASVSEMDPR